MYISTCANEDGSIWINFNAIGKWHYSPLPLGLFEKDNNCIVLSNCESEMSRAAKLQFGDIEFELIHDDLFDNTISTRNPNHVSTLEGLAINVAERIASLDVKKRWQMG